MREDNFISVLGELILAVLAVLGVIISCNNDLPHRIYEWALTIKF